MSHIPSRKMKRGRHKTVDQLAYEFVYAGTYQMDGIRRRMRREFGREATSAAIRGAREVQKMVDPGYVPALPPIPSKRAIRAGTVTGRMTSYVGPFMQSIPKIPKIIHEHLGLVELAKKDLNKISGINPDMIIVDDLVARQDDTMLLDALVYGTGMVKIKGPKS